jgi:hypothetical protein
MKDDPELNRKIVSVRGQLARARQARDPERVATLEMELIKLTRKPPAEWECVSCEREFENEEKATRANVRGCPGCKDKDTIRPTLSSQLPHDRRPGKTVEMPQPTKRERIRRKALRTRGQNVCPCGCGRIPEGGGVFWPGHDGRISGWIKRLEKGDLVKAEVNQVVWRIYRTWIEEGKPGGEDHPKLRDVAIYVINKMRGEACDG